MGAFNIKYIPHASVKGEVLTDLVVEITEPSPDEMTEAQHINAKLVDTVSLHGILAPYGTILGVFNIKYIPHASVKGQVLMDLVTEIVEPSPDEMTEAQHINGKLVDTVLLRGILCPEWYMLMALQIKVDPKWG